jgi:PAS domain S-box-containing protein
VTEARPGASGYNAPVTQRDGSPPGPAPADRPVAAPEPPPPGGATVSPRPGENAARLRALFASNVIGVLFSDVDGSVYDCNEELARIIGRPRAEVLAGKVRWTDITAREDLPLDERAIEEARATGRCKPYEKHYLLPDGRAVPVQIGYVLLEPERRQGVAFVLDISERKAAEERARELNRALQRKVDELEASQRAREELVAALTRSNEELAATARQLTEERSRVVVALEAAELGSFSLDAATLQGEWDPRACEILGSEEWSGDFLACVAEEDRPAMRAAIRAATQARLSSVSWEFRAARHGRWCRAAATLLSDPASGARAVGTLQDVTELKRAAEETHRREELQRLLVGVVSHDLRNPLSAVRTGVEVLFRSEGLPDRHVKTLLRVRNSALRMERLVRDLLDYTVIRGGETLPVHLQPCRLSDVVEPVVEEVEATSAGREIARQGDPAVAGRWDADRLSQVVSNLLTNAVKYGAKGTPVRVRWGLEGDEAVVAVHNDGSPIAPDLLERIFEPLVQLGDRIGGIGLGLFIAREIVRSHGGRMRVTSTAAEGTTFEVRLPAAPQ